MRRVTGLLLGAFAGLAFSTLGLVDFTQGVSLSGGGNDATPIVIAVGIAIGALVGATVLWRFPFAILGAIVGLAAGMWLRDNLGSGNVQPPWVFFLLFGLPAAGLGGGYLIHLPRSYWERHSAAGSALVGLAAAVLSFAVASFVWATATRDPACEPAPLPGGGVRVLLCPDRGAPIWILLAVAILGVAVGLFTARKLNPTPAPGCDGTARTS